MTGFVLFSCASQHKEMNERIQARIKTNLGTKVAKQFELKDFKEAIEFSQKNSGKGKVVFKVGGE